MFIQVMLVLIFLILVVVCYALRSLNDNLIHFGRQNNADNVEMVLLQRGIKNGVWRVADRDLIRRN